MSWLSILIAIPLAGAALAALAGSRLARWVALAVTVFELATAGHVARLMLQAPSRALTEGLSDSAFWLLRVDGLSLPLVLLTSFLGVVAILASWDVTDRPRSHFALLLGLEAAVTGVFLAADLISFYAMWEAVLIPMFFLIGSWGHENRRHAALKFFLYTFAGSALMLLGFVLVLLEGRGTSFESALGTPLPAGLQPLVFGLVAAGLLVKIPVWPLHTWLPDAHVEAPTAGSVMLAGVLLKMGGYGILRVLIPMAPSAFDAFAPWLAGLGVIGIVYGALTALAQTDLKRLVAYSSVAHMGFVVLAIAASSSLGVTAAMLGMVSHGLVAGLSFLLVGLLYERTHTRDLARLGGLGHVVPRWAAAFTFAALASLGLPGLSGFPGEIGAVLEGFRAFGWWVAPLGVGIVLGAAYNLVAVRRANHGPRSSEWSGIADLATREMVAVGLLGTAVIALGAWPRLVVSIAEPAARALATVMGGGS